MSAALSSGFFIFVQGAGAFAANFADGDILLDTFFTDGPVTLTFSSAVRGVGFNIAHEVWSTFQGTMDFYGAGNVLFGSVTSSGASNSDGDGSAPFLGGASTLKDIVSVVINVDTQSGSQAFAINGLSLLTTDPQGPGNQVPEPATYALMGTGLVAGALLRRRNR